VVRQVATGTRPFVNRHSEREWLEERLDDARGGQPQLVLISGEPGIGKSRLVREVQRTATIHGFEVCSSRCREHLDLPYLPFAASLLPRLQTLTREDPSLSRYAPVIDRLLGDTGGSGLVPGFGPEGHDQTLVFVAVTAATIKLAQHRPLLLVVDDLQWADRASLNLFTHLALEIADTAMREPVHVLIVATYRRDSELPADVERLRREEICHHLALAPLPAQEAGELVRSLGLAQSTRQLEDSVYHVAGGNPLFIENVVHQLTREGEQPGALSAAPGMLERAGPREITDAIAGRLADLPSAAQATLTLAAVIGDRFDPDRIVAAAADTPTDVVFEHLDAATALGILEREGPRTFHFAHPLYARAAYNRATPSHRRQLHLDVVRSLEDGPDAEQQAIEIARHLGDAGADADPRNVLRWCREGGDRAWTLLAWAEAARCYEAATDAATLLDSPPGAVADLAYKAGVAHYRNSDPVPSSRLLERAKAAYRGASDPGGVARAVAESTRAELTAARFGTQIALEPLEAALADLDDPALQARLVAQMADVLWLRGDVERGREFAERAVSIGAAVGEHEACTRAFNSLAVIDWLGLHLTDALGHLDRALEHARASNDPWLESIPLPRLALTQLWLGDIDVAAGNVRQANERSQTSGDIAEQSLALAVDVALRVGRGDFRGAERVADEAWLASRVSRYGYSTSLFLPVLAMGRMLRGAFGPAESAVDKLVENDDAELYAEGTWLVRQLVRAHAGQRDEVLRALMTHPERVEGRWPVALGTVGRFAMLAEIADLTDTELSLDRVNRALARAADRGMILSDGPVLLLDRVRAIVARRLGRVDDAEQLLRSAMARATELRLQPELGRAYLDLARLLVVSGRGATNEATELATLARALFDELDMPAFEQQAGALVARTSGTARSPKRVLGAETAVILFTDIADSTALTERLGDAAYLTKAGEFERTVRGAVRECEGEDIEGITLGDGVLAVFSSGTKAIECAIRAHDCARDAGFRLHVGIHAGDVLRTETGVHGGAVNIAARVCDAAPPGETLVSDTVRSLARTSASVQFVDRGLHQFKGVSDPHQVFAVQVGNPSK
jgi:class 3 adenylate cyclase/tetratricopeptide (TPR) repeat protein